MALTLEMKKLMFRAVKGLAKGHTSSSNNGVQTLTLLTQRLYP